MVSARLLSIWIGLAVLGGAVALELAGGSHAAVSQTMNAWVHENDDIGMSFADGSPIGSQASVPPTIPPGTYTIHVVDDADIHNFDLTGPGVSMATDLGGSSTPTWTVTLQPGSTYRFQCDEHSDFMWGAFQTSGTAPSSGGTTTTGSGGSSSVTTTGTSSGPTQSNNAGNKLNGTLAATVGKTGKVSLKIRGRAVKRVAAGRYKLTTARKLFLQQAGHKAKAIARSTTVTLSAGRWGVYVAGKPKTTFVVA